MQKCEALYPFFDLLVRWEYTVVPKHQFRKFAVVSDRQRYDQIVAERGDTVPMRVAKIAELTGTTVRTVRYYHSLGLLPVPAERGGWRDYELAHVARLFPLIPYSLQQRKFTFCQRVQRKTLQFITAMLFSPEPFH